MYVSVQPDLVIKDVFSREGLLSKLLVFQNDIQIKVEPNLVFRGYVYPCESAELCEPAQEKYLRYIEIQSMSKHDVYAGKLCAALDRQHPRDLYDVKFLFEQGGISKELLKAFVVYLVCSPRPISELLNPNLIDISAAYNNEFIGMTDTDISLEELLEVRKELIKTIQKNLTDAERKFILSVKLGTPDLALINLPNRIFPGLEWKVINIQKMQKAKHTAAVDKLKSILQI